MTIMFFSIPICKADCNNEEIVSLKKETNKIKVEYEHIEKYEEFDEVNYNKFNVDIKNVPNDYYIMIYDDTKYVPENGSVRVILSTGNWDIKIYSNKCNNIIDTINLRLPRFNMYSIDPLCEGISGEDFPLCGKYYEYDVSYDNFKQRLEHYKKTYKIDNNKEEEQTKNNKFDIILKYLNEYKLYIGIGLCTVILIIVIILLINKKRNRGVLK